MFKNGSKINTIFDGIGCKYVKNQTLFNMIKENTNMNNPTILKLLIEYKFDFETLANIYDNIKQHSGFIQLATCHFSYSSIKLLIKVDH